MPAVAGFLNARTLGIPEQLVGDKYRAMAAAHPAATELGELAGSLSGGRMVGALGARTLLRAAPRLAKAPPFARSLAAHTAYGALFGTVKDGDPVGGAMAAGFPNRIGGMAADEVAAYGGGGTGRAGPADRAGGGRVPLRTVPTLPRSAAPPEMRVIPLSPKEVLDIKKTLQTEWSQRTGPDQAKGIIDTILNRVASGHWGSTVSDVVNRRSQFTDINGRKAWKYGRHSVEQYPIRRVSRASSDFVDSYLAQRARGSASSVGTHLNYANPFLSDKANLPWIMKFDGPVFGTGRDIHRHGTPPEWQKFRPKAFSIVLP